MYLINDISYEEARLRAFAEHDWLLLVGTCGLITCLFIADC